MDQRYLKILDDLTLQFRDFIILILVYEEAHDFLQIAYDHDFISFTQSVRHLESEGLVKWIGDDAMDIILRKQGEDLFKKHVGTKKKITTAAEVKQWIDSWREIFPSGTNTGGYRYRGDKGECVTKMIKFVNEYDYTIEQIFEATRIYVERFSQKGYAYMQLAHFFIKKQGVGSNLAAECESLSEVKPNNEENTYGKSIV